jgi:hypothetical protein
VLEALVRRLGCAHLGHRKLPESTAMAILAQDLPALVRLLTDNGKCHRASSEIQQIVAAIARSQRLAAKGFEPFILCRDPDRAAACLFAARDLKTKIVLGTSIPPGHRGPVIIVHGYNDSLGGVLGQLLMCDIELVTTNALAPDSDAVVRAFRRGSGHLTSLEFAPRSYRKINRRIQTVPLESRLGHLVATEPVVLMNDARDGPLTGELEGHVASTAECCIDCTTPAAARARLRRPMCTPCRARLSLGETSLAVWATPGGAP